jgi:hypothetical protein
MPAMLGEECRSSGMLGPRTALAPINSHAMEMQWQVSWMQPPPIRAMRFLSGTPTSAGHRKRVSHASNGTAMFHGAAPPAGLSASRMR